MCGKAAVSHLSWKDVYAWASSLTPPDNLPPDPDNRINISPSRLRRQSEPDSMVWETLPITYAQDSLDVAAHALWPYLPFWSKGALPRNSAGKIISTANARYREEEVPFAPTFMHAWKRQHRVVVWTSWFYEFDSRVHPQVPWAVFPLQQPFWAMAGLASFSKNPQGVPTPSVAIITVAPNDVLRSVGHHRSPALLRDHESVKTWLRGTPEDALSLLGPHDNESMGVESVPMGIKIPGNEALELPRILTKKTPR